LFTATGIGLIAWGHWRVGGYAVGAAVLLAGVLRLSLRNPGILAIRGKAFDGFFYLLLGAALVVIAAVVPPSG
jgi:hypothetical protein